MADPIDAYVGGMIRALRKRARLTQHGLADAIGTTFQQVQKYERAANRVSASRLHAIAGALNLPVGAFFPGMDEGGGVARLGPMEKLAATHGGYDLAEIFIRLDANRRRALLSVADALDTADADEPGHAYVTGGDDEARRHVA